MARIVDGNRSYPILNPARGANRNRPSLRGLKISTRIDGKKIALENYAPAKVRATSADMALVQEHFGTNMSESLQLSLHMVAQAIREGRMNVGR